MNNLSVSTVADAANPSQRFRTICGFTQVKSRSLVRCLGVTNVLNSVQHSTNTCGTDTRLTLQCLDRWVAASSKTTSWWTANTKFLKNSFLNWTNKSKWATLSCSTRYTRHSHRYIQILKRSATLKLLKPTKNKLLSYELDQLSTCSMNYQTSSRF